MGSYFSISDNFNQLSVHDYIKPGTKFVNINDNNIYIFIGYGYNKEKLICARDNSSFINNEIIIFNIQDIGKIIYNPTYEQKKRFIVS